MLETDLQATDHSLGRQETAITTPFRRVSALVSQHGRKLVALALWLSLIIVYTIYVRATGLTPVAAAQSLVNFMQSSLYGPLVFVTIYALRPLIFFSAAFLTIAGGFLFGPLWGVIYTVVAANTSAMLAFFIGRYFGEGLIEIDGDGGIIQRYANRMQANSFETVLIMRFIFLPYDLVNYLGGLLRLDWSAFLLATIIGSIPGTISFALIGASLDSFRFDNGLPKLDLRTLFIGIALFVVSLLISQYFKRREQSPSPS